MTEDFGTSLESTVDKNIKEVEARITELIGVKYTVGLRTGTAALHLASKLACEK